jgi:CheY-like chemotaxis protein
MSTKIKIRINKGDTEARSLGKAQAEETPAVPKKPSTGTSGMDDAIRPPPGEGNGKVSEAEILPYEEPAQNERWVKKLDVQLKKLQVIGKRLEKSTAPPSQRPEAIPPPVSQGSEPALPSPGPSRKKKILVVDDDQTTVKIITHFLKCEEFSVTSSLSGVEGLKLAFRECPDLIILDVMMPDLNGFQFLSIYREDRECREIPVVILSSLTEEADVLRGLDLGAVDYVTKPFSPEVLVAKVKKKLDARP